MSFHPNMVGRLFGETPWFASDMTRWWFGKWGKWYSSSGYARRAFKPILRDSLPRQMEGLLPEQRNERLNCIENQFIAILWFIGKSLNYKVYHKYSKHALNSLFPGLNSTDLDFIVNMPPYDRKRRAHPVGVILQVVMNHEMLKKYCYASKPFGRPLEEDVQSFYQRIKNKKDSAYSIRCAIGNDFHNKTSGIRIRAITPIAKDKEAMERIMRMLDGVGNQQVCEKNAKLPSLNAKLIRNARKGNLGEVNDLIKAGADIDSWDNHSKTSLFWAARNGHVEVVRALLKARADVNAQDNHGRTPLMEAALQGHIEIVQALISAEADVKMLDMDNMTAFALIKKRFFKPKNYAAIKAALKASK
jgi:hypothetical protein